MMTQPCSHKDQRSIYITKAPSQGKIEQKCPIFPLTKALCYLFDMNGPMKSSDTKDLSFFPFFQANVQLP